MLVLSRKIGERLIIDGSIEIEILEFRGKRVRLGVNAPPDVRVCRAEVPRSDHDFSDSPSYCRSLSSPIRATD
jgi:carbon storage regulator